jgi:hypothetical protein
MEKQQFTAITFAIGLLLLQGCGGSGADSLIATPSDDDAGRADPGVVAVENTQGTASAAMELAVTETVTEAVPEMETESATEAATESAAEDISGEELVATPTDADGGDVAETGTSDIAEAPAKTSAESAANVKDGDVAKDAEQGQTSTDNDASDMPRVVTDKGTHASDAGTNLALLQPNEPESDSHSDAEVVVATSELPELADVPESTGAATDTATDVAASDDLLKLTVKDALDTDASVEQSGHGIDSITDLLFLTGQSNAASLVTRFDAELDAPDSRVFAYTDQGWRVADLHQFWDEGIPGNFSADDPTRDPYNNIIFQVGKALATVADRRVGIVMLTAPGEGISHWDYDGEFYSRMREHALAALNAVPHKSSFDALVWMQGETDWLLEGTADPDLKGSFESYQSDAYVHYYPRKLTELIANLRSDPWFGDKARFICTETVKAAVNPHLMWLNNDDDALTGCAAASDLAARDNDPHGNHFSAESLRVLGKRIAEVYLELLP